MRNTHSSASTSPFYPLFASLDVNAKVHADEAKIVAMAGHTRRFNPSHQWVLKRIKAGDAPPLADPRPLRFTTGRTMFTKSA